MLVMLQEDENGSENAAGSEARVGRDECDEAEKGIVFLYRLVEGRSSQSHGYECALNAGVPHNVSISSLLSVQINFIAPYCGALTRSLISKGG